MDNEVLYIIADQ